MILSSIASSNTYFVPCSQDDTTTHQQQRGSLPPSPSTRSSTSSIPIKQQQQQYNTPQSSVTSGESDVSSHRKQPTRYYDEVNELDRELLKLTKEKEKVYRSKVRGEIMYPMVLEPHVSGINTFVSI